MLRWSALARAARCHYDVLGVGPAATMEEIKRAFRERAKKTHPDAAGATSADTSGTFREMVDAYRVLRDPKKRSEYDTKRAYGGSGPSAGFSGGGDFSSRDPGFGEGSARMRAKMYGYQYDESQASPGGRAGTATAPAAEGTATERAAVAFIFLVAGFFLVGRNLAPGSSGYVDPDPYPNRRPKTSPVVQQSVASLGRADGEGSSRVKSSVAPVIIDAVENAAPTAGTASAASHRGEGSTPGHVAKAPAVPESLMQEAPAASQADEMVRAYYNPFAEKWHRIPEGYDAPAAMDLTAWHKKRTDPTEWSRLFAEGRLSEIIPRGGLRVRYRPAWDTFAPILVKDPHTGKTVLVTDRLPKRGPQADGGQPTCEIRF